MTLALIVLGLAVVLVVWRLQGSYFITEYLFFVRIPLVLGVALALLPTYGPALAPDLMGNVFVLDRLGAAVVTFSALSAMWSIAFTGRLIWISTPARCMLFLSREKQRRCREDDSLGRAAEELEPNLLSPLTYVLLGVVLTIPLLVRLLQSSPAVEVLIGYGLGLSWAVVFLVAARHMQADRVARFFLLPAAREMPEGVRRYHRSAAWFFLINTLVYVGFFVAGNPHFLPWTAEHMPALTYVYLLVMLADWILSAASFQLDRARTPLFPFVLAALFTFQSVWPGRHLYKVNEFPERRIALGRTTDNLAVEALRRSWERRDAPASVFV